MGRGSRDYALWSIGIVLVLVFALVPVLWLISVSLKPPEAVTDGRFIPSEFSLDNYKSLFEGGVDDSPFIKPLINSIGIALITTVIAITLAASPPTRSRLEFPAAADLAGALAIACSRDLDGRAAVRHVAGDRAIRHLAGMIVLPDSRCRWHLRPRAFFARSPGAGAGGQVDGATPFQASRR